ncbi:MAG TPA: ABC transporter substrate-binding protein [Firmicutes bacterium]|nr:ABC transporter substrate-binding protein [Bacillota bacterium]
MKSRILVAAVLVYLFGTITIAPMAMGSSNRIVMYTALQQAEMDDLLHAFKKATGIDVDFVCLPAGEITTRIRAEASNPQVDIFLGGSSEMHDPLAKDGLLVKYDSPVAKEIDKAFHDPNGYWHGWYLGALGIVINRDRFKAEMPPGTQYPKTWDDLLNPAYKGKFVTSNPSTAGGAYIFMVTQIFRLGEERAFQFLKELDKNVSHYTPSAPAPIQLVATGQFLAGMSWGHDILRVRSQGYPIDLVYPQDTGWEIGCVSIVKGGPNTEAAKKFVDWVLSKEAGEINTRNSMRYSARKDVPPPAGVPPLSSIKLVDYDRKWANENADRLKKKWESTIRR